MNLKAGPDFTMQYPVFGSSDRMLRRTNMKLSSKFSLPISRRDFWLTQSYSVPPGRRLAVVLPCIINDVDNIIDDDWAEYNFFITCL